MFSVVRYQEQSPDTSEKKDCMCSKFYVIFLMAFLSLPIFSREYVSLEKWKFHYGECENPTSVDYDDSRWENVVVPHDWAIEKPFDMRIDMQSVQVLEDGDKAPKMRSGRTGALPAFGVGYYRTCIESKDAMRGKRISVEFDGAMSMAKVYLNGNFIGEWPYGYSSFSFDLTDNWNYNGNNVLAVRLENKPESSRWYPGAGIYRKVRLAVTDPVCVSQWGTYVTTPKVSSKEVSVNVQTSIDNNTGKNVTVRLESLLMNAEGELVRKTVSTKKINGCKYVFKQNLKVKSPVLWDISNPYMYNLVTNVYVGSRLADTYTTPVGLRSIEFDNDKGFFLNGKNIKIKGVCLHHDLGPLGAAVNYRALERQLQIMQEMGCNAIRTSHNPPAPELLDLCDRMGLLVQAEAFDEWKNGKNLNGYNRLFDKWAERDLQAMIWRDRNHPSVIMWSIGNEVREQKDADGAEVARMLTDICHREDPSRPVTAGFNNHKDAIKNGLADVIDLVGFNYKPHDYKEMHQKYPDWVIYGSETASTVSTRGEYKFPVKERKGVYYDDYQVSSYDLEYPSWGSTPDTEFEQQDDCDFIFGEFVWTGFDYLGEPTPYNEGTPARSSYFGIVDLAGLKKDRYYLYQSKWSEKPVFHVLPHWNWEERVGQEVPVFCYTNYPKAELFVNGKSMGVRQRNTASKYERYRLMWKDVVYQPGEIKVVAYNNNGDIVDTKIVKTAGRSYKIRAVADRKKIKADGKDLSFVTVEILDKEGNLCPKADNLLFFDIEGDASIKAVCNGDPTCQIPFSSSYMPAFNGKLVVIVQSDCKEGTAKLKIYGGHLKPDVEEIYITD